MKSCSANRRRNVSWSRRPPLPRWAQSKLLRRHLSSRRLMSGACIPRPTQSASRPRSCARRPRRRTTGAILHRSPTGGPYGPDTCLNGDVWREAVANDHVCVIPPRGKEARNDDAQAAARPRRRARLDHLLARPAAVHRRPCTQNETTPSASACAPTTSTWARRPCSCTGPTPAATSLAPADRPEPERAGRPARLRQRDAALLGRPERVLRGARPVVGPLVASRQRPDGLLTL